MQRQKGIGRGTNILDSQLLIDALTVQTLGHGLGHGSVIAATGQRLIENRRIGGKTTHPLRNPLRELAALDQLAMNEIEPGRLAMLMQGRERWRLPGCAHCAIIGDEGC